ncbi:MAG TPA: GNAT family N-acetyltransferase [Thermoanaerobaculaceae bacterium]|nr:GNAT family N-acetyltransferase [Thermoanaerobaculaceae bacterium]
MTTYWVRPARPSDFKAVRELARRVRREFHLSVRGAEQPASDKGNDLVWVVEAGRGEIVGCCGVREGESGVWELHSLFLAPDWRGFGLGKSLVERALKSAQEGGALSALCRVPSELAEAAALLRGLGFHEDGTERSQLRFVRTLGRVS